MFDVRSFDFDRKCPKESCLISSPSVYYVSTLNEDTDLVQQKPIVWRVSVRKNKRQGRNDEVAERERGEQIV